ncbi:hypothetical protein B0I75DRAFT_159501 [Yarrowia lipolytica]|nr:hypothetical protein B0I74DRAFT_176044 [Yarrowia lipolytica]RDW51495.1 hypothetical protein B0I75DRAFT_159501 [Yarrowia lipolytica]
MSLASSDDNFCSDDIKVCTPLPLCGRVSAGWLFYHNQSVKIPCSSRSGNASALPRIAESIKEVAPSIDLPGYWIERTRGRLQQRTGVFCSAQVDSQKPGVVEEEESSSRDCCHCEKQTMGPKQRNKEDNVSCYDSDESDYFVDVDSGGNQDLYEEGVIEDENEVMVFTPELPFDTTMFRVRTNLGRFASSLTDRTLPNRKADSRKCPIDTCREVPQPVE